MEIASKKETKQIHSIARIICYMKNTTLLIFTSFLLFGVSSVPAQNTDKPKNPNYNAPLAKKLGADERGMKMFVLCILKTGPKDAEFKGKERDDIFSGHFANINKLAGEGKLAIAGPFEKNDKAYRGLYVFNVATIEDAEKLVVLDPAVKAGVFVPELTLWYATAALMEVNRIHNTLTP